MTGRNVNIYFQEETYNKIKGLVSQRKISKFINEAAEEKLAQEQKKIKDNIKKQLIADYQDAAQDKELNKELVDWDQASSDGLKKDE